MNETKVVSDKCSKSKSCINSNQDRVTPIHIVELQPMKVSEDTWKRETTSELDEFIHTKNDVNNIPVNNKEVDMNSENVVHIVVETIDKPPHISLQKEFADNSSKSDK